MVKHWYKNPVTDKFICDIKKSKCVLKSKDCLNCDVYQKWINKQG